MYFYVCMHAHDNCIYVHIASRNGKHQQQPHRAKIPWHPPSRPLPFYSIPVLPMQHEAEKEAQEVRINGWEGPAAEDKHLVSKRRSSVRACHIHIHGEIMIMANAFGLCKWEGWVRVTAPLHSTPASVNAASFPRLPRARQRTPLAHQCQMKTR
jgi:hypothetical protein